MKLVKSALLLGLVCAAFTAQAAAPAPAAHPLWKGFYLGASVGSGEYKPDWTTTQTFNPEGTSPAETFTGVVSDPHAEMKESKTTWNILLGYNWQVGPKWVVGVEGRWGKVDYSKSLNYIPGLDPSDGTVRPVKVPSPSSFGFNNSNLREVAPTSGQFSTATVEIDWNRAIVGRAGYLLGPKSLLYVALGYSQISVTAKGTCPGDWWVCDPAAGTQTYGISDETVGGWTYGLGFEQSLAPHWFVRAEYTLADYDSTTFTAMQWSETAFGAVAKLEPTSSTIGVGVAYKF